MNSKTRKPDDFYLHEFKNKTKEDVIFIKMNEIYF